MPDKCPYDGLACFLSEKICGSCSRKPKPMQGWICPRCVTVHSPFVQQCHCLPPTIAIHDSLAMYAKKVMTIHYCYPGDPYYQIYLQALITYQTSKKIRLTLIAIRKTLKRMCMTDRWQGWEGKKMEDMNG